MADTIDQARDAAIRSLVRDLRIERDDAERWCSAWEQFARRYGGARSPYFWDAARGWIDAQRAMGTVPSPTGRPPAGGRSSSARVATVRQVDRAS